MSKKKDDFIAWEDIKPEHVRDDLPFFQFDPNAWIVDREVRSCELEEVGIYITLLSNMWVDKDCSLDPQIDKVSQLFSQKNTKKFAKSLQKVLEKFFLEHPYLPEMVTQKRLMFERVEAVTKRKKRANAGRRGMRSRWGGEKTADNNVNNKTITIKNKKKNKNKDNSLCVSDSFTNNPRGQSDDEAEKKSRSQRKSETGPDRNPKKKFDGGIVADCLVHYEAEYVRKFGRRPLVYGAGDSAHVGMVVETYGADETKRLISDWLDSEDRLAIRAGFPLRLFPAGINALLVAKADPSRVEGAKGGKAVPKWLQEYRKEKGE